MAKKNTKKMSIRKYVNWILFLIAIVLVCIIASKIYNIYQTNKLKNSVLTRVVGAVQYDDIDNAIKELVSDDFIFISYVKSFEVRKLESKIKNVIIENELQNNFYYLDATDLMLEEDYIETINSKFKLENSDRIEELPALLYYKNKN